MNDLTFTAKLVGDLVWPATVGILGWIFRGPLGTLIGNIRSVSGPGGWSVQFGHLTAVTKTVQSQQSPPSTPGGAQAVPRSPTGGGPGGASLPFLGSPSAAIVWWWSNAETSVRSAGARLGLEPLDPTQIIGTLYAKGRINSEAVDLFSSLVLIRNAAVHDPRFSPSDDQVLQYQQAAETLIEVLSRVSVEPEETRSP